MTDTCPTCGSDERDARRPMYPHGVTCTDAWHDATTPAIPTSEIATTPSTDEVREARESVSVEARKLDNDNLHAEKVLKWAHRATESRERLGGEGTFTQRILCHVYDKGIGSIKVGSTCNQRDAALITTLVNAARKVFGGGEHE